MTDTSIASQSNDSSYSRLIQSDRKGCMLYPMSGSDISPLLIFPNVDTFVFVDEHLLLNEDDENKIMAKSDSNIHVVINDPGSIVDGQLIVDIMAGYGKFCSGKKNQKKDQGEKLFPLSFPMFSTGGSEDIQYDFSSPYSLLFRADVLSISHPYIQNMRDKGIVHLLITRIHSHTDFVVNTVTIINPRYVYRLDLEDKSSGKKKTIYYVREHITCEGETEGTDWIKAQHFVFETLLIKGDPYYANYDPTNTTKATNRLYMKRKISSLCESALIERSNSFRLVTDQKHRNGAFASLTASLLSSTDGTCFGYDNLMAIYGADSIEPYLPLSTGSVFKPIKRETLGENNCSYGDNRSYENKIGSKDGTMC